MFQFSGRVQSSKSLLNRALVIQSYSSTAEVVGESAARDVILLQKALQGLKQGDNHFEIGEGGTTFRFLLARASRLEGEFLFNGSSRLFSRPHEGLYEILRRLGVEINCGALDCRLRSKGWAKVGYIETRAKESSQFLSAILLNSWGLEEDLIIRMPNLVQMPSFGYLEMTQKLVNSVGHQVELSSEEILIPAKARVSQRFISVEPDISSVFTLSVAAVLNGEVQIFDFPERSLQPDYCFLDLLSRMGAVLETSAGVLTVRKTDCLQGLRADLSQSPDLFPCLSLLSAFAEGDTVFSGLSQLRFKESDRLGKTQELLTKMGVSHSSGEDFFQISGCGRALSPKKFVFDPDEDHRMAFAAGMLLLLGWPIEILHPQVVDKSYPNFWKDLGLRVMK